MRTKWLMIALPLVIFAVLLQSAFWVPTYDSQTKGNPGRLVTFLQGSIGDVKLLNPAISSDATASTVMEHIFEALVDADENLKLRPHLAERWEVTEEAYLAVLPGRKLPDGTPVTARSLLAAVESAWKSAKLSGAEASIVGVELVPAEQRTLKETVLRKDETGKAVPLSVELSVQVPERVKFRLSKVEPDLFKKLESVVGSSYFSEYPFAERFKLKKPEYLNDIRPKFPELLGVGEHNPIITFYLRPGIRWHDGQPLTAHDVRFTYEAISNPKNASPRSSSFEPIKSVEVIDELTARVVYKELYAPAIIDWAMQIIPKHLLDDKALEKEMNERGISKEARATFSIRNSNFNRNPIGTGPFRFVDWQPEQYIRVTRNDKYWGARPEYKDLYFRVIPDYLTMELEFRAGALDVYSAQPHQADRYRKDDNYHVVSGNQGMYTYIGYNLRRPLFKDVRVRRALGMALDINSLIKYVLYGEGKRATGPYYSNTPYNDPELEPLPYDPKAALALLAEAGYKKNSQGYLEKDGKVLEFTLVTNSANPQRKAIMTVAQEAWQKLGINCKTQVFEWTVFLEQFVSPHNFDAIVLGWVGGDINPDKFQLWHSSQTDKYELNHVGYQNAEADRLIERIREEYEPEEQIRLARELHKRIAADQPYTFLYEPLLPTVLDKRIVLVDRKPDGREVFSKIEAPPSGDVTHFFEKWRKLPNVPQFSP